MSDRRRDLASEIRRQSNRTRPWVEAVEPRLLLANFIVTRADDSPNTIGGLTLRQAIEEANRLTGPDSITFEIAPTRQVISPLDTALPVVTDTVFLDASAPSGFFGQRIVLDGSNSPTGISGLVFTAPGNTIRGLTVIGFQSAGSSIGARVGGYGIVLNSDRNLLDGNSIGQDGSFTPTNLNNDQAGLLLTGSSFNTIGAVSGLINSNTIAGNSGIGILIADDASNDNLIYRNFIGDSGAGNGGTANPNLSGIVIQGGAARTVITGGNFIASNLNYGIDVGDSIDTLITSNTIGNNFQTGSSGLYGIRIQPTALGVTVGGINSGAGNTISHNGGSISGGGILVEAEGGTPAVSILGNSIFSNGPVNIPGQGLGIDLGGDGVTPNRFPQGGLSPTDIPNYPVFNPLGPDDQSITGTLFGVPNTVYRVEFFLNSEPDPSGFGEGKQFDQAISLTTDLMGAATFSVPRPAPDFVDRYYTATATSTFGRTSEFSQDLLIPAGRTELNIQVTTLPQEFGFVGDPILYQARVRNDGEITALNVSVINVFPGSFTFESVQAPQGATIIAPDRGTAGATVIVSLITLDPGQEVFISFVGIPTQIGVFDNLTQVTSQQTDINPLNNEVITTTEIRRQPTPANLNLSVAASPDPAFVDDLLTYTISVTNSGESPALGLVLTDLITTAADVVRVDSAYPFEYVPPTADPAKVVVQIARLDFNQTASFQILVRPNVAGTFGNIAIATASNVDQPPQTLTARVDSRFVYSFVVTNADDSGPGSLRRVVFNANRNPGPETITFAIPTNPVIQPVSLLPVVSGMTTIDATSQAGFAGSPVVVLDGSRLSGASVNGLAASAMNGLVLFSDNVVKGMEIRNFAGSALVIDGGVNNRIVGNLLHDNGESGMLLRTGSLVDGISRISRLNTIGGTAISDRNVIHSNAVGINLQPGTSATLIQGNYVGTDASGQRALGNDLDGILINDAPETTVGGVVGGAGNLITDSGEANLQIFGAGSSRTLVQGNRIGTNAGGSSILFRPRTGTGASTQVGVLINGAPFSTIGGNTSAASNLVSGHQAGIQINGAGSQGTRVAGNLVGTNLQGTSALPNGTGVLISGSSANTIGGLTAGDRNLLSGNRVVGLRITGPDASNNLVAGNLIGTDTSGQRALGNGSDGVFIDHASGNTVGGSTASARNVISGNVSAAVQIFGASASANVVAGNAIGASIDGSELLSGGTTPRNGAVGIFLNDAPANVVGGSTPESGNLIAHFAVAGVQFNGKGARGNLVANNRIEDNTGYGVVSELEVANEVVTRGLNANLFARNGTNIFRFPTAGPSVVQVQTDPQTPQTITVQFSRSLSPTQAGDRRNYRIEVVSKGGRVLRRVPLTSALYDDQSRTVTLTTATPVISGMRYRLTVLGGARRGVRDANGVRLDGDLDGVPGGDFMIRLGGLPTTSQLARRHSWAHRPISRNASHPVKPRSWHAAALNRGKGPGAPSS